MDYNEGGLLTRYEEAVFVTFLPSPGKDMFAGLLVPCDHFSYGFSLNQADHFLTASVASPTGALEPFLMVLLACPAFELLLAIVLELCMHNLLDSLDMGNRYEFRLDLGEE